jgi:hypothetical protein
MAVLCCFHVFSSVENFKESKCDSAALFLNRLNAVIAIAPQRGYLFGYYSNF